MRHLRQPDQISQIRIRTIVRPVSTSSVIIVKHNTYQEHFKKKEYQLFL